MRRDASTSQETKAKKGRVLSEEGGNHSAGGDDGEQRRDHLWMLLNRWSWVDIPPLPRANLNPN